MESILSAEDFFAVLLLQELDGLDQLIKLNCTVLAVRLTRQHQEEENLGNAEIQTQGSWVTECEHYSCAMLPFPKSGRLCASKTPHHSQLGTSVFATPSSNPKLSER